MNAGQIELAKSYIAWMRGRNTLSLDGYYPGWENAARDSTVDDNTCARFESAAGVFLPPRENNALLCRGFVITYKNTNLFGRILLLLPNFAP